MENPGDPRRPWTTPEISADVAIRGFFGAVDVGAGRRGTGARSWCTPSASGRWAWKGAWHRFEIPDGGPDRTIELLHEPGRPQGSWTFGAGTAHHIAFNVETDEALVEQKAMYEELGYTDTSEVKDRFYFHSMYVRSPGGVLVECTANVPGGFYVDELPEELGTHLNLPPWYEDQRGRDPAASSSRSTVPEANRPKAGVAAWHQAAGGAGAPGPHRPVADQRGVLQETLSRRRRDSTPVRDFSRRSRPDVA